MDKKKITTSAITAALVASSLGTIGTPASAASKYELKKGKLVSTKTGKTVKGYAVYKGKLYKNGKVNKGYALVGKGTALKLYYNASLKKGYKTASNKKYLFKDGKLVKGFKQAGNNSRLYKNGVLTTGYKVYQAKDETVYLYYKGQLKQGLKTATYNGERVLFKDGFIAKGDEIFKQQLYTDGKLNTAFKQLGDVFYNNGVLANGEIDGLTYAEGKLVTSAEEIAYKEAKASFEESAAQVTALTKDYEDLLALEALLNGEKTVVTAKTLEANASEVAQFIQSLKGKDLTNLSAEEKAKIAKDLQDYKKATTEKLQVAVASYLTVIEKVTEVSKALVEKDPTKATEVQATVAEVKVAVSELKEKTKVVQDLKIEVSTLESLLKKVEKVIEVPATEEQKEKPAEDKKPVNSVDKPSENVVTDTPTYVPPVVTPPTSGNSTEEKPKDTPQQPTEETKNPETVNSTGNIADINKPLDEIVKLVSFNVDGGILVDTNDTVTIQGVTYVVNDDGYKLEGPTKYVEKLIVQQVLDAYNAAVVLLADENATDKQLTDAKAQLNMRIGFLKQEAINVQINELQTLRDSFYNKLIITDEKDLVALRQVIAEEFADSLPEGVTVKVENVILDESKKEYTVKYTLQKGDVISEMYSYRQILLRTPQEQETEIDVLKEEFKKIKDSYHVEKGEEGNIESFVINDENYVVAQNPAQASNGKYITLGYAESVERTLNRYNDEPTDLKGWKDALTELNYNIQYLEENWTSVEREEVKNIPGLNDIYVVHERNNDLQKDYDELLVLVRAELTKLLPDGATLTLKEHEQNGGYIIDGIELTYTISKGTVSYTKKKIFDAVSSSEEASMHRDAVAKLETLKETFKLPSETEDGKFYVENQAYTVIASNENLVEGHYIKDTDVQALAAKYNEVVQAKDDDTINARTFGKLVDTLASQLTTVKNAQLISVPQ